MSKLALLGGPGDEVLTVAYTWVATVGAILRVNAVPIFADVDPQTFCMDLEDARRKITPNTKAILPVDFYGHPAPLCEGNLPQAAVVGHLSKRLKGRFLAFGSE